MEFRLYKMTFVGKVAFVNMLLTCCALTVILLRECTGSYLWWHLAQSAEMMVFLLSFPVGWFAALGFATGGPDEMLIGLVVILLPLNAYVWGWFFEALRLRKSRRRSDAPREEPQPDEEANTGGERYFPPL